MRINKCYWCGNAVVVQGGVSPPVERYWCECTRCAAGGPVSTTDEATAIEKWNSPADIQPDNSARERVITAMETEQAAAAKYREDEVADRAEGAERWEAGIQRSIMGNLMSAQISTSRGYTPVQTATNAAAFYRELLKAMEILQNEK
ncbi:MAG: hypothetical protein GY923_15385 [Aestuariibacter sp.]|nr:hypothetical protein [Aestuariibacter sp.]